MRLYPEIRFKWDQPEAFRLAEYRRSLLAHSDQVWKRLILYSLAGALCFTLLVGSMNRHVLQDKMLHWGLSFAGYLSFLCLFSLIASLLFTRHFISVRLCSDRITKSGGVGCCLFAMMSGFHWTQEADYFVLQLTHKRGGPSRYGVPDIATRDQIEAFLFDAGLAKIRPQVAHP